MAAITVGLAATGTVLRSGRGSIADAVLAIGVGWFLIGVLAGILLGLGKLVRGVPPRLRVVGFVGALIAGAALALPVNPAGLVVAVVFVLGGALVGAAAAALRAPRVVGRRRGTAVGGLTVGLVGLVTVPLWLLSHGGEPAADPWSPDGSYDVTTLTYGNGEHRYREVFGADVDVVTAEVDGSAFLGRWTGRASPDGPTRFATMSGRSLPSVSTSSRLPCACPGNPDGS